METALDVVATVAVLAGVGLSVLGGVGLHRFEDVFDRMHAATKPATLGLLLVLGGALVLVDTTGDAAKLGLVAIFQFLTAPVAAHMAGRAAHGTGTALSEHAVIDELAEADAGTVDPGTVDPGDRDDRPT